MPKAPEKSLKFSNATKERVRKEAEYRCESCGTQIPKPEIHHRLPQAIAREKHPDIPADLVTCRDNAKALCTTCHEREDRLSRIYHDYFADELRKKIKIDLR